MFKKSMFKLFGLPGARMSGSVRKDATACDFTMAIARQAGAAAWACIGYELAMGRRCTISCGLITVAIMLCPRSVVIAIAVTALLMAERYSSRFQYLGVPAWTAGRS